MSGKTCPVCNKDLTLKQINFNLAVYICEDLKCKYPVGYDCIVVERKLEDIEKNLGKDCDLHDWIDNVVSEEAVTLNNTESESGEPVNVNTSADKNSTDWIDSLVEEAVNEVKLGTNTEGSGEQKGNTNTDFDEILNFMYSTY